MQAWEHHLGLGNSGNYIKFSKKKTLGNIARTVCDQVVKWHWVHTIMRGKQGQKFQFE